MKPEAGLSTLPLPDIDTDPPPGFGWRQVLLRMGHWPAVLAITGVSLVASVLVSWAVWWLLNGAPMQRGNLIIAVIVPLLVAPPVSHVALKLLYELADSRARLHQAAIRDGLTGVYNRRFFMARLDAEVARAQRSGSPLSMLMIDVDHFKAINDTHGHAAGDQVLETVTRAMIVTLRPDHQVARYGGEEFAVLMPGAALDQACIAAAQVRAAVQALAVGGDGLPGSGIAVTASLGVSCLGGPEDTAAALLKRADEALYAAKDGGRNRWVYLKPPAA
ncbi:MAG: GGDEF domain-containing protein [Rubrivivax sp.]